MKKVMNVLFFFVFLFPKGMDKNIDKEYKNALGNIGCDDEPFEYVIDIDDNDKNSSNTNEKSIKG